MRLNGLKGNDVAAVDEKDLGEPRRPFCGCLASVDVHVTNFQTSKVGEFLYSQLLHRKMEKS